MPDLGPLALAALVQEFLLVAEQCEGIDWCATNANPLGTSPTFGRLTHLTHQIEQVCKQRKIDAEPLAALKQAQSLDLDTRRRVIEAARVVVERLKGTPPLTPTEARNKFCFDEWVKGQTLKEISTALKRHPEWEKLGDEKAVRGPIKSWAKKTGQKVPRRNPGRPPSKPR